MNHATFENVTRRASMFSLAAGAKNKAKKKQRQKCQAQVGRCEAFFTAACDGDPECLANNQPCCTFLASCDFTAFLICKS